jgi:archaellum component FlaC
MARFTSVLKLAMPVAALAFLLSGCEDLDARSQTSAVSKQLEELKAQVSDLKARNEDNTQKLKALTDDLRTQIDAKIEKSTASLDASTKDLISKFTKDSEDTRNLAKSISESARGDYKQELDNYKKDVAKDVATLREEIKKSNDDLKKFMDNQLRELYPYAYQPHRVDPATPPAENK